MGRTIITRNDLLRGTFNMPKDYAVFLSHYYLVQASLVTQENPFPNISTREYLNEYCTVRAKTSRQTGHTTAMQHIATYFEKPIIFSRTHQHLQELTSGRVRQPKTRDAKTGITYYTTTGELDELHDVKFDFVGVDCASMMDQEFFLRLYDKYESAMRDFAFKIILLSG